MICLLCEVYKCGLNGNFEAFSELAPGKLRRFLKAVQLRTSTKLLEAKIFLDFFYDLDIIMFI
jgi:hypothetical protein